MNELMNRFNAHNDLGARKVRQTGRQAGMARRYMDGWMDGYKKGEKMGCGRVSERGKGVGGT